MTGPESEGARLDPGDIFFTRGDSIVSQAIRLFTRRFGESRTKVNHVGVVVEPGTVLTAVVVEALVTVKRHPLGRYATQPKTAVAVYRPISLTPEESGAVVAKAGTYVDRRYGYFKLVTHFLDWLLQGAYVFRRLTNTDNYPICSWVVAYSFQAADRDFGVPPGAATPDDVWDFAVEHPQYFEEIRPLAPLA